MRSVFLDLETTGLDPRTDEILEIGILDDACQCGFASIAWIISVLMWTMQCWIRWSAFRASCGGGHCRGCRCAEIERP